MEIFGKKHHPSLRLIVSITRAEDEKKVAEVFRSLHIPVQMEIRAKGTAPSELLDAIGLGGTTRVITMGIIRRDRTPAVFEAVNQSLSYRRRGGGIALTMPLTGVQGAVLHLLGDETNNEKGEASMAEQAQHAMILVSVNAGHSDEVIDAARDAGARGGTVIKGRRSAGNAAKFLGISVQEEQDYVMIVLRSEKKAAVMKAITAVCGLNTPAHGIALSLPVDSVMGLE